LLSLIVQAMLTNKFVQENLAESKAELVRPVGVPLLGVIDGAGSAEGAGGGGGRPPPPPPPPPPPRGGGGGGG
jgi:hypothetical protein